MQKPYIKAPMLNRRQSMGANFLANPAGSTVAQTGGGITIATENIAGGAGNTGAITSFVSQNTLSTVNETLDATTLGVRHITGGADTYVYTNEFASTAGRTTLTDSNGGNTDIVNASAVSGNSTINLTNGSTSTVAGKSLTINGTQKCFPVVRGLGWPCFKPSPVYGRAACQSRRVNPSSSYNRVATRRRQPLRLTLDKTTVALVITRCPALAR
jgi:hypothetical protein